MGCHFEQLLKFTMSSGQLLADMPLRFVTEQMKKKKSLVTLPPMTTGEYLRLSRSFNLKSTSFKQPECTMVSPGREPESLLGLWRNETDLHIRQAGTQKSLQAKTGCMAFLESILRFRFEGRNLQVSREILVSIVLLLTLFTGISESCIQNTSSLLAGSSTSMRLGSRMSRPSVKEC